MVSAPGWLAWHGQLSAVICTQRWWVYGAEPWTFVDPPLLPMAVGVVALVDDPGFRHVRMKPLVAPQVDEEVDRLLRADGHHRGELEGPLRHVSPRS